MSSPGVCFLAILFLVVPQTALAVQILPIADGRRVELALSPLPPQVAVPVPAFSPFVASLFYVGAGDASQSSAVAGTLVSGSGGDFTDGAGATTGFSRFDVSFQVDQTTSYSLAGEVSGDLSFFTLALSDPSSTLFAPVLSGFGPTPFSDTGVFVPGVTYRFVLESMHPANAGQVGPNEWSFTLAVPEPARGALGLAAVLALAARRYGSR